MEDSFQRAVRSTNQQQARHEALIDAMNKFLQFQDAQGNPILEKRDFQIGSEYLFDLSVSDINHGVVILTDFFNMPGGSIGGVDLYKLLQAYFLDADKRKEINRIIGY